MPDRTATADRPAADHLWQDALPALFVVLWATGFIGSKMGAPYSEPFTFLMVRFLIAAALMGAISLAFRARWPESPARVAHAAVVGVLVHGIYLGGVFWAIDGGVPAGIAALIVALQPLLTGLAAGPALGERVTPRQWGGLALGFVGVALVVWRKLDFTGADMAGLAACFAATAAIAAGTLYQKRFSGAADLRTNQTIQLAAAAAVMVVLAFSLETRAIDWAPPFIVALTWLVGVMSVGTFTLLYFLVRRGAASKVASLFYLVPPVTATMAFFLFDETLGPVALAGMAATVVGVALATRR